MLSRITSENPYHALGGGGMWLPTTIRHSFHFKLEKPDNPHFECEKPDNLDFKLENPTISILTVKNPTISEPVLELYLLNLNLIFTLTV